MPPVSAGSRKHLLDLLTAANYPARLNALLHDHGVIIDSKDVSHPNATDSAEWELPRFIAQHCPDWCKPLEPFDGWWVKHRGRLPVWDLISTCSIRGHRGLLLIEAKAHEAELDTRGKPAPAATNAASAENHDFITACIDGICSTMRARIGDGVTIAASSHYQLANRIAWAWRAAASGVPVALLYLGFTGDTYFKGDDFVDGDHWQRTFGAYMAGGLPLSLPGRTVELGSGGSFVLLVKSLVV